MAAAVQVIDDILKEYLLFRGFTSTLKAFDAELKADRDKSFRVNKIVEQLVSFVSLYDLQGIRDYWSYLRKRFFSRLDNAHYLKAQKLEKCLYRFYLVNAVQTAKSEKVTEFFEKMASDLQNQSDWKEWFVLPFLKNPEQNPSLEMYFSQQWQETFPLSLYNFLNAIFQSMPLPRMLKFDAERIISEKLQKENKHLHQKILTLQQEISILQDDKERKAVPKNAAFQSSTSRMEKPKVTKTKEKEANFIQRRFRHKNKDQQEKEPKVSLRQEHETEEEPGKQSEILQKQFQQVEETSDVLHENQNFDDMSRVKTTNSEPVQVDRIGKCGTTELEKDSSIKTQNDVIEKEQLNPGDKSQSFEKDDVAHGEDHLNNAVDQNSKVKRTFSLSAKMSPRVKIPRRHLSSSMNSDREMVNMMISTGDLHKEVDAEKPFIILGDETFSEHRSPIVQCDFSASGKLVASVDSDGIVKVWKNHPDLTTLATIMSKSSLLCIEWASKIDKVLLLGTNNGKIRLYDTESKTTRFDVSTDSQYTRIVSLASSPFGTSFVSSATVDIKSSKPSALRLALSTDQEKHSEGLLQGTLLLWDLKTMKLERHLPLGSSATRINCIAYNHNGTLLVTGGADGMIRIYDTRSYDCLMSWEAHVGQVSSVQFSVDETFVFSMGRDNQFLQWSLRKLGLKTATLATHDGMSGPRDSLLSGRTKYVLFSKLFTFDSKGEHLLTCSPTSGIIYKYNKNSNSLSQVFSISEGKSHVTSVDWSTAGDFITCLTGSLNGHIRKTTLLKR